METISLLISQQGDRAAVGSINDGILQVCKILVVTNPGNGFRKGGCVGRVSGGGHYCRSPAGPDVSTRPGRGRAGVGRILAVLYLGLSEQRAIIILPCDRVIL